MITIIINNNRDDDDDENEMKIKVNRVKRLIRIDKNNTKTITIINSYQIIKQKKKKKK
jgi:hypothetical protein